MRLFLDQMVQADVADELRAAGHDVLRASETGQARAEDDQILATAIAQDRILVTLDQHFGNWAVLPLSRHPGVIRLQCHPTTPAKILDLLRRFLRGCDVSHLQNHLVIVGEKRARWVKTADE
jgi:predicted nuclease of predicted toxin-antitoxin system